MDITKQLELAREYLPDGYVIVPIEPTEEMIIAATDAQDAYPSNSWGKMRDLPYDLVYKAMINEAQK